jgi:hypothetical protein
MLQWCYSGVTVVLHLIPSGVTAMLQWCGVTVLLQSCYNDITIVYSGVTMVFILLEWCYRSVTVSVTVVLLQ